MNEEKKREYENEFIHTEIEYWRYMQHIETMQKFTRNKKKKYDKRKKKTIFH